MEWLTSGGAEYCQNCKKDDLPCSRGLRGQNGKMCPMQENAARNDDEHAAMSILSEAGHKLVYSGGMSPTVIGFDWTLMLMLLRHRRLNERRIVPLLIEAEKAMVAAMNRKDENAGS